MIIYTISYWCLFIFRQIHNSLSVIETDLDAKQTEIIMFAMLLLFKVQKGHSKQLKCIVCFWAERGKSRRKLFGQNHNLWSVCKASGPLGQARVSAIESWEWNEVDKMFSLMDFNYYLLIMSSINTMFQRKSILLFNLSTWSTVYSELARVSTFKECPKATN